MKSPLFNAMNGNGQQAGPMAMMQNFQRFMNQMRGQNPNAILQQLVQSGRITQDQINQAQQQAQQMRGVFDNMRGMFGF